MGIPAASRRTRQRVLLAGVPLVAAALGAPAPAAAAAPGLTGGLAAGLAAGTGSAAPRRPIPPPVPAPDPVAAAAARARASAARLRSTQAAADAALRAYHAAVAGVVQAVSARMEAETRLAAAQDAAAWAQAQLDDRIRALYTSGGPAAVYVTVLTSGPADFPGSTVAAGRVLGADADALHARDRAGRRAAGQAAVARAAAAAAVTAEDTATRTAKRLDTLLRRQRSLLAGARAEVARQVTIRDARAAAERRRVLAALAQQSRQLAATAAAQAAAARQGVAGYAGGIVPASAAYLALYHSAAGTCPGLPWGVLAAIGQVETGHGRNTGVSPAGAMGPMQFLPSTFAAYAVDGDGDGRADILNPADAIYTAARYLCANGAATSLRPAIWHYNHADWYVDLVLALALRYV